LTLFMA